MRAVIYSRKSTPDPKNPGKSVADQAEHGRKIVEDRKWDLVAVLEDDGVSASRHGRRKARPGFERLCAMVERDEVDVIVTFELSRLTRRLAVLGQFLEQCQDHGVKLVVDGRDLDPARSSDVILAGVVGSVDAGESARTRERVLRDVELAAMRGRLPAKGVYGYVRRYDPETKALLRVEVDEAKAAIVKEIVRRTLAGQSMRSITLDLNRRAVPVPTGKPGATWHQSTVRRLALNPAYSAQRVHHGKVVADGNWPAIIGRADHERVRTILMDESRLTTRDGSRRWLLAGIMTCGCCGSPLRSLRRGKPGRPIYGCGAVGCMKTSIVRDGRVEAFVELAVVERLRGSLGDIMDAMQPDGGPARDRIAELRARQAEIGAAMAAGDLSLAAGAAADRALAEQIREAEAELRRMVRNPVLRQFADGDVGEVWAGMGLEQRASVIRAVVVPVLLPVTVPGRNRLDFGRVRLDWI